MMQRSPNATLSPFELATLRRLGTGETADVHPDHLRVLLAMGLAGLDVEGAAALTIDGQRRLREAQANR